MILYFSATGNGQYISEQIAGRTKYRTDIFPSV